MKIHRLSGAPQALRALSLAGLLAFASIPHALAATDIQVWHSLNAHNGAVFEKLVKQFNRDQNDVKVSLKAFGDNTAVEAALADSAKGKKTPHLVQIDDNRNPDAIAQRKYILPLYNLLAKHPSKTSNGSYRRKPVSCGTIRAVYWLSPTWCTCRLCSTTWMPSRKQALFRPSPSAPGRVCRINW